MVKIDIGRYYTRADCRLCGSVNLKLIIDFGLMPHAGDFLTREEIGKEKYYPLRIFLCKDCFLLQIIDIVPSNVHFSDYRYLSSIGLSDHFTHFANSLKIARNSFIVEIGSNDGVLLRPLGDLGYRVLGVDPARNIAQIAKKKGIPMIIDYFTEKVALNIKSKYGKADVIIANNVLAHIDDMDAVFSGIKNLLNTDGVLIFEVHYLPELIEKLQYDFFYTEHLSYYMLHSLKPFLEKYGFVMTNVEIIPVHSGSIRVYAKQKSGKVSESKNVIDLMKKEEGLELLKFKTYFSFAKKINTHKKQLSRLLHKFKIEGKKVVGYGASGRANTVLNAANIDRNLISYIVDASKERYNRFTPGMHIPIISPQDFHGDINVDYVLLFAWSYKDIILIKEKEFIRNGGKFVVPFPSIEIVPR